MSKPSKIRILTNKYIQKTRDRRFKEIIGALTGRFQEVRRSARDLKRLYRGMRRKWRLQFSVVRVQARELREVQARCAALEQQVTRERAISKQLKQKKN